MLIGAAAFLGACQSLPPAPPPPPPVVAKVSLQASGDVNPDVHDRPSPIVIRVYQLKDVTAFNASDFFALYGKEQQTLNAALLSREEYELAPGESRSATLPIAADARFIAVVAAYRDIQNAQWRAVSGSTEQGAGEIAKTNNLTIAVNRARVTVTATH